MRIRAAALLLALLGAARPAAAQEACSEHLKAPPVGGWGEYQVLQKAKPDGTMRFAMVGTEQRAGKAMHWFEIAISSPKHGLTVMKALVPGYPYEPGAVEELIMKSGNHPPMKMSGAMLGMMQKQMADNAGFSVAEECRKMKFVGVESVTVPAGTFRARHYRDETRGGEVWIASGIPFGMVRVTDGKEFEMRLAAHGKDAKTAITETPMEMPDGK